MNEPTENSANSIFKQLEAKFQKMRDRTMEFAAEIRPEFDAMQQAVNCAVHEGETVSADWESTLENSWPDRRLNMVYSKCPECESDKAGARIASRLARLGIPKKLMNSTFATFSTEGSNEAESKKLTAALAKAKRQVERGKGFLLLVGFVGSGKSHLAASAIRAIGNGRFVTHGDLIAEIRATYSDKSAISKDEIIERYQECPCLVLDELGVRSEGKDEEYILYSILAYRHDRDLLTAITSNNELGIVKTILGDRLIDRMAEDYTVINLDVPSHRRSEQ